MAIFIPLKKNRKSTIMDMTFYLWRIGGQFLEETAQSMNTVLDSEL